MKRIATSVAIVGIVVAAMAIDTVSAHLTAVSPYTYWRDVVPIFEARCGRCHGDGSASGVSLFNYQSARGATWLIRQQLVRSHMPPWFAEGPFKSPTEMTARELNILLTWASGGGPEGQPQVRSAPETTSWPIGPPDLVVPMPSAFTFTADQGDQVYEVKLPSAKVGGRLIRAVDLSPGTPAIVRSAEIIARSGTRDQVLGLWQPGELPATPTLNAGFQVPAAAQLVLRIRYRRWFGAPASDRSQLGVYFANREAKPIEAIEFSADPAHPSTQTIKRPTRVIALRPVAGPSGAGVQITLVGLNGSRRELGRITIHRDWARRYVFETPVLLEAGNKIEVLVIPSDAQLWSGLTGESTDADAPVRFALEVVN